MSAFSSAAIEVRKRVGVGIMMLGLAAALPGRGGTVAAPYQVGTWAGFRNGAVSFTFDDDCANQYIIAQPLFQSNNLNMTLFTVTSWETTWPKVQLAAAAGDEIGSHTVTHPDLTTVSPAQLTNELANSQATINSYVTNEKCLTLAYPYCTVPSEAVTAAYYIAARICSGVINPSTPSDFYRISSYVCGNTGTITNVPSFTNLANSAANNSGWCVYLIHGIDNDGGYSPTSSAVLTSVMQFFNTNRSRFWVQTFGNVVRYIRERNAVSISDVTNAPYSITVHINQTLDDSIYNYPITVRRPLPAGWPEALVTQNGLPLDGQIVTVNSTACVMFDAVPNAGDVLLTETAAQPVLSNPGTSSLPNFTFQLSGDARAVYTVYSSGDLVNWSPVLTNLMTSPSTNLTLPAPYSMQYYRAQWSP